RQHHLRGELPGAGRSLRGHRWSVLDELHVRAAHGGPEREQVSVPERIPGVDIVGELLGRYRAGDPVSRATQRHRVAVVGAGYWGPNLIRNFLGSADWDLVAVCDLDETRARRVLGHRTAVDVEISV